MRAESLVLSIELQASVLAGRSLQRLAAVAALRPQDTAELRSESCICAAQLCGFVDACFPELRLPRGFYDQLEYGRVFGVLRDVLGDDMVAKLVDTGATMTEGEVIDKALAR